MIFHFTGIKDVSGKNYTLEFLIEGEGAAEVKNFLSNERIVIIGIEIYSQPVDVFGNFYAVVEGEKGGSFKLISNVEKLEALVPFLVRVGFNIKEVNHLLHPINHKEVEKMIEKHKKLEEDYLEAKRKKEAKQKEREAKFQNKKLKKAYAVIDELIDQIDQISTIGGGTIHPQLMKKLDDSRADISKLRLATNYDKIIEELSKGMDLIVESQNEILKKIDQNKIFPIANHSIINNIDVIKEQAKLSRINLMGELGLPLTTDQNIYLTLKTVRPLINFLQRDILESSGDKLLLWKNFFYIFNLLALFVVLEVTIFSVFSPKKFVSDLYGLLLLHIGILIILLSIIHKKIQPKNSKTYLISFLGLIVVYTIIVYFFKIFLVI